MVRPDFNPYPLTTLKFVTVPQVQQSIFPEDTLLQIYVPYINMERYGDRRLSFAVHPDSQRKIIAWFNSMMSMVTDIRSAKCDVEFAISGMVYNIMGLFPIQVSRFEDDLKIECAFDYLQLKEMGDENRDVPHTVATYIPAYMKEALKPVNHEDPEVPVPHYETPEIPSVDGLPTINEIVAELNDWLEHPEHNFEKKLRGEETLV